MPQVEARRRSLVGRACSRKRTDGAFGTDEARKHRSPYSPNPMAGERRRLRVLCTSTGGAGHINALAPIAIALRDAGHDVRWAVGPDGGDAVASMGFAWSPAGLTTPERRAAAAADIPAIMQLPMGERRGPLFTALFARAAMAMRRDLGPILDDGQPDVVIRETAELAAAAMAPARGIPIVTVAFSGVLPAAARPPVVAALGELWQAEGRGDAAWSDLAGDLYVHPFPPSFGQAPETSALRMVRAAGRVPDGDPPPWVAALGDRPAVYVSAGTEPPSTTFPWAAVLVALGRLPVDAVVTIGPHVDEATLGPIPSNARVERFVPQAWVLSRVTGVISHGGAGTVLGAAAHGRPQLVVPLFADQWENGLAVVAAGCGAVLGLDDRGEADVAAAVGDLLDASPQRDAAARVATEIAAMPTPADLVPDIEALG
jgi:UDP:flavonoid glycosyltransferase YjiC (YdhE family)